MSQTLAAHAGCDKFGRTSRISDKRLTKRAPHNGCAIEVNNKSRNTIFGLTNGKRGIGITVRHSIGLGDMIAYFTMHIAIVYNYRLPV